MVVLARGEPYRVHSLVIDGGVLHAAEMTKATMPEGVQRVALNPLSNGHDHGRPHSPSRFGAHDQPLELWLTGLASLPEFDPYTATVAALCQAARGGVSAVVLVHDPKDLANAHSEARLIMRAATDVGLRMGLVVPIKDRVHSVYGAADDLLDRVPTTWKPGVRERWGSPPPRLDEQLATFKEIASEAPPLVDVQLGPIGPQWCTDNALHAVAELSEAGGHRVHMHLLESRLQREWADATFADGLVQYLDDIGLLGPRLAVAHGVWLTEADMELIADRGATVVVNTSSNLRLSSGLAPLAELARVGVDVALGLDSLPLLEPGDMFREWELARTVQGAADLAHVEHCLLQAVTVHGHYVAGREFGQDIEGGPGDVAIARWDPSTDGALQVDAIWAEMRRRGGRGLDALYVGGELVVAHGEVVTVEEETALAELAARIEHWERMRTDESPLFAAYRSAVRQFYDDGCHQRGLPKYSRTRPNPTEASDIARRS